MKASSAGRSSSDCSESLVVTDDKG
jgi:hypothetical protein